MLSGNPPTAALILSEYTHLKPGDWVVQNSANSGVGRSLIAIAKARGLRTINFVRRRELLNTNPSWIAAKFLLSAKNVSSQTRIAAAGTKNGGDPEYWVLVPQQNRCG